MSSLTRFTNKDNTIFTVCDCGKEILKIDYDKEYDIADLAIYRTNHSGYMSFWQKIGCIWKIFVSGNPYNDQIILKKSHLLEIKNFIDSL